MDLMYMGTSSSIDNARLRVMRTGLFFSMLFLHPGESTVHGLEIAAVIRQRVDDAGEPDLVAVGKAVVEPVSVVYTGAVHRFCVVFVFAHVLIPLFYKNILNIS